MNEIVKKKRIEQNLSINELARRSGVDKKTIRLLEAGTRKPKQVTLEAIAKGLGITFAELTGKDPTDYSQRSAICSGCYYWRRESSYGSFRRCCHYAASGKGSVINGKLDMINGVCHAKTLKKRNPRYAITVRGV